MGRFVQEKGGQSQIVFPKAKSYFCPYCKELIMKGNVKRLSLRCPNCNHFINADANDLTGTPQPE